MSGTKDIKNKVVLTQNTIRFEHSGSQIFTGIVDDPTVVAIDGKPGDLIITVAGQHYIKSDTGKSSNWGLVVAGTGTGANAALSNLTTTSVNQTLNMNSNNVSGLGTPTLPTDATTKSYVDVADALLVPLSQKGTASGIVPLDASSKIPSTYLPAIAITDSFVVTSQAAMLALVAQTGDVAIRTDISKTYILQGSDPTVLSGWLELLNPGDTAVQTVNGKTGPSVTVSTTDITEGTNLYHTTARAKAAAVANTITSGVTDVAPSQDAVFTTLTNKASNTLNNLINPTSVNQILNLNNNKIQGVGTPTLPADATTKAYVDAGDIAATSAAANKTLSNLTSPTSVNLPLNMNSNKISGLGTPTLVGDAATKAYVDTAIAGGSGANITLGNLATTTAVSSTLLPNLTNTISLGSTLKRWLSLISGSATISTLQIGVSQTMPDGTTNQTAAIVNTSTTDNLYITTASPASGIQSKAILLETGKADNQNSGDITIATGAAINGGSRGILVLNASELDLFCGIVPVNDSVYSLGNGGQKFAELYVSNITAGYNGTVKIGAAADVASTMGNGRLPAFVTGATYTSTQDTLAVGPSADSTVTRNLFMSTPDNSNGVPSGTIGIYSGSGNTTSGGIEILTGTGPTRGTVKLDGSFIDVSSKQIKNLATPTLATDAATKAYVDAASPTSPTLARAQLLTSTSATGGTVINFNNVLRDTQARVTTGAAWKFTANFAGDYDVYGTMNSNVDTQFNLFKNGVFIQQLAALNNTTNAAFTNSVTLAPGDYLDFRLSVTATIGANSSNVVNIKLIK